MTVPYKQLNFSNKDLTSIQENVGRALNPLLNIPLLDGVWLQNVIIPPAGVDVDHKLGREWRGYIFTRVLSPLLGYSIYTSSATYDKTKFLRLNQTSLADLTVDIWVF